MNKKELVAALRVLMAHNKVDAVYITGTDPHGSDGVQLTGVSCNGSPDFLEQQDAAL